MAGDGYVDITFTARGNKSVTLSAGGPLTGPKTTVDTLTCPARPRGRPRLYHDRANL